MYKEDLNIYLAHFGERIKLDPADGSPAFEIKGIVDRDPAQVDVGGGVAIETQTTTVLVKYADIKNREPVEGDEVCIYTPGETTPTEVYLVRDIARDRSGFHLLTLDEE